MKCLQEINQNEILKINTIKYSTLEKGKGTETVLLGQLFSNIMKAF